MKENIKLKDIIFDDTVYPTAKRISAVIFIITVFLLRIIDADKVIGLTITSTISGLFVVYFICKLLFYNTKRSIKDIIFLIIFILLFIWGLMTYFNM